jgi:hypothetical protein
VRFVYGEDSVVASPSNRRLFYRLPMYLRINLRASGIRAPVPATLVDLSGGGGMVTARTMLKTQLAVEFDLPRDGQPHLRLPGKIRKVSYSAAERTFQYAVEFDTLDDATREALLRFIIEEQRRTISVARRPEGLPPKPKLSTRLQEQRAHRRIDVNVPVRIALMDVPGSMEAVAIDVSTGGCRILIDHVLRQEWTLALKFTLPDEVLRAQQQARGSGGRAAAPFQELKVNARALPGVKQSRGKYIQSLIWVHPDPKVTEEISRFVQAAQLASLKK